MNDLERRIERLEGIVDRVIGVIAEEIELMELEQDVPVSGVPYKVSQDDLMDDRYPRISPRKYP